MAFFPAEKKAGIYFQGSGERDPVFAQNYLEVPYASTEGFPTPCTMVLFSTVTKPFREFPPSRKRNSQLDFIGGDEVLASFWGSTPRSTLRQNLEELPQTPNAIMPDRR